MNFPMITEKGQLCIVPFDLQNWFSIIILDVKLDNPSFIPGLIYDNIKVPLILFLTVNWINPFLSSVITWIEFSLPKGFEFRLCVHFQSIKTIQPSTAVFERKYKFDPTNERYIRKLFTDDVLKEIFGSNEVWLEPWWCWRIFHKICEISVWMWRRRSKCGLRST